MLVQVVPIGIAALDEIELPLTVPALEPLFVCDAVFDRVAAFGPHQTNESAPRAIVRPAALAMLAHPMSQ